jgi:hypothetical protein
MLNLRDRLRQKSNLCDRLRQKLKSLGLAVTNININGHSWPQQKWNLYDSSQRATKQYNVLCISKRAHFCLLVAVNLTSTFHRYTNSFNLYIPLAMPAEIITSIVLGLLQIAIGLAALWQQYRLRELHRMLTLLLIPIRCWLSHDRTSPWRSPIHDLKNATYTFTLQRRVSSSGTRQIDCKWMMRILFVPCVRYERESEGAEWGTATGLKCMEDQGLHSYNADTDIGSLLFWDGYRHVYTKLRCAS